MDRIEDFEVNSPRWLSLKNFEGEVWKDVPNFEGFYLVSNMGRIKSLDRETKYQRKQDSVVTYRHFKGQILKASNYGEYLICHLKANNTKKAVKYHRIVCAVFHPNPNNLPEVNHINEIKTDNRADNLEWCTRRYNALWGTAIERQRIALTNNKGNSVVVYQFTLNGDFVAKYPSINEAGRVTGIEPSNILSVCNNKKSSSAGGYLWSYTQDPKEILYKIKRKKHGLTIYGKRRIIQYSLDGKFIKEYNSIKEASIITGINKNTIQKVCSNYGYQKTAGGYKWAYSDENQG